VTSSEGDRTQRSAVFRARAQRGRRQRARAPRWNGAPRHARGARAWRRLLCAAGAAAGVRAHSRAPGTDRTVVLETGCCLTTGSTGTPTGHAGRAP
jgi:hypothetical protein